MIINTSDGIVAANYIVEEYDLTDDGGTYHIIKYNNGLCEIVGKRKLGASVTSVAVGGFHRATSICSPPIALTEVLHVDGAFHNSGIFMTCNLNGKSNFEIILMRPNTFTLGPDNVFTYDLIGYYK